MKSDTRAFIALVIIPCVSLVVLTVVLGLTLPTAIPADVTGLMVLPVWALGMGRSLSISHALRTESSR